MLKSSSSLERLRSEELKVLVHGRLPDLLPLAAADSHSVLSRPLYASFQSRKVNLIPFQIVDQCSFEDFEVFVGPFDLSDPIAFVETLDGIEVRGNVFDFSNEHLFFDEDLDRHRFALFHASLDAVLLVVVDQAGCGKPRVPSRVAAPL